MALTYKKKLQELEPKVEFLMTLYLTPTLTPEAIRRAKVAGIVGNSMQIERPAFG